MSLKLYYDLMSQPSRALYILLKHINYDFIECPVDLRKGQHYSDEYTKLNRFQKVPLIDYNGFILSESVAMLSFLSRENVIGDDLYPQDSKTHARIEEYLLWHQVGLRLHCAMYFRVVFFSNFQNKEEMAKKVNPYKARMKDALNTFDTKWLGRGNQFLIGDKPTVADLIAATEIEQPRMAGFDASEHYENIKVWMAKVKEYFNPHYDEAHVILNKIVKKRSQELSKL